MTVSPKLHLNQTQFNPKLSNPQPKLPMWSKYYQLCSEKQVSYDKLRIQRKHRSTDIGNETDIRPNEAKQRAIIK